MYRVTLRLSAQSRTVVSSMSSTVVGRRIRSDATGTSVSDPAVRFARDGRAALRRHRRPGRAAHPPPAPPVRRYGEEKMELLDRLGHASSLAEDGPLEPRTRIGWETVPSSAPAADPLPRRE